MCSLFTIAVSLFSVYVLAPEIYGVAVNENAGYSFHVDWWSLGVSIFELLLKKVLPLMKNVFL